MTTVLRSNGSSLTAVDSELGVTDSEDPDCCCLVWFSRCPDPPEILVVNADELDPPLTVGDVVLIDDVCWEYMGTYTGEQEAETMPSYTETEYTCASGECDPGECSCNFVYPDEMALNVPSMKSSVAGGCTGFGGCGPLAGNHTLHRVYSSGGTVASCYWVTDCIELPNVKGNGAGTPCNDTGYGFFFYHAGTNRLYFKRSSTSVCADILDGSPPFLWPSGNNSYITTSDPCDSDTLEFTGTVVDDFVNYTYDCTFDPTVTYTVTQY